MMDRTRKSCDYCGKPMRLWVGIKRTCFDDSCRASAKREQQDGPEVSLHQMMKLNR